jgi:hypothetical protein
MRHAKEAQTPAGNGILPSGKMEEGINEIMNT